jgi:hypothetical protein
MTLLLDPVPIETVSSDDYQETISPNCFVSPDGSVLLITGEDTALLFRQKESGKTA